MNQVNRWTRWTGEPGEPGESCEPGEPCEPVNPVNHVNRWTRWTLWTGWTMWTSEPVNGVNWWTRWTLWTGEPCEPVNGVNHAVNHAKQVNHVHRVNHMNRVTMHAALVSGTWLISLVPSQQGTQCTCMQWSACYMLSEPVNCVVHTLCWKICFTKSRHTCFVVYIPRSISRTRGCTYIGLSPHWRPIFSLANKHLEVPVGKIILLRGDEEWTYLQLVSCHMVSVCTAYFVFAPNQQIVLL